MRINLQLAYLGLLSVTCISSCFLFFVFLTENAKFVAACSDESTTLPVEAGAAVEHKAAAAPPAIEAHAEIIPINEEVEKLTKNEGEHIQTPQTAAPAAANAPNNVVDDSTTEPVTESAEGWLLPSSVMYSASASDNDRNDIIREKSAVVINEAVEPAHQNENEEMIAVAVEAPVLLDDDLQNVQAERESMQESLPDITEIPTITVTELPLEILEPTRGNIEALVIDAAKETIAREHENHTLDVLENSSEAIRKDEEIIKFDDSGGGEHTQPTLTGADLNSSEIPSNIPIVNATKAPTKTTQNESDSPATATPGVADIAAGDNNDGNTVNLTVEEVPIPVFSEWAQKQMEAAEKQQAKEQEVVNTATQKKNHTNGDGKRAAPLKMRNKNYASPDCGAKIIASNADASNTGAVLSSSKDEYMLSPCGNRIWFVVELCEAIQAQKVELANFELFSSSPKNFTVAVSNRFPTRDWSNVGRFIAEDKRNVQSFDLHPHLFGKFVRVDIHSHYSKEHFCPVSLFRVFGTSEFEAFETEDTPHIDLDDFDDEFGQEQVHAKSPDINLFKSASDAVLSIVKKAAEVLVKPANQQNTTLTITQTHTTQCRSPATGPYNCVDCSQPLVARINNALSCEYQSLQALLRVPWLLKDLLRTRICAKDFGIELKAKSNGELGMRMQMDVKNSYYLNLLPREYVGALCQMLATQAKAKSPTTTAADDTQDENAVTEPPLNLTIDKKLKKDDFRIIDGTQKKLVTSETTKLGDDIATENAEATFSGEGAPPPPPPTTATSTTESGTAEAEQIARPPQANIDDATTTTHAPHTSGGKEPTPDVNIFNVPAHNEQQELQKPSQHSEPSAGSHTEEQQSSGDSIDDSSAPSSATTSIPPANGDSLKVLADSTSSDNAPPPVQPTPTTTVTPSLGSRSEEDAASWENIDNLITSTTAAPSGGEASALGSQPGVNLQQKIPSGPQSESVFIRLSNRIKALERNMSLSGQYLEELSRRYKKQVEELQLTLTQTVQTVRTLEEQNRRQSELQQLLAQRNTQLKEELDDLSLQVHACIVVIIFVGAFVFLVLMVSILFYRSMRRQTKEVLALYTSTNRKKTASAVAAMQKKLNRRKSFEDFSDHQQSGEKMRRPSEEALMILKESSDGKTVEAVGDAAKNPTQRERKMSICYSNNMSGTNLSHDATIVRAEGEASAQNIRQRRKGEKHSWPNTEHAQQQARRHLAQLNAGNVTTAELMENFDKVTGRPPRAPPLASGVENHNKSAGNKSRRKTQLPRRQASVSHDFMGSANSNNTALLDIDSAAEYDESLRLEEDDLDNFIPTSDLAYNEFMPEGPSGYQVDDGVETVDGVNADSKKSSKKLGRLTAPAFFKSPFGKSRNKLRNSKSTKHPHESTSWEWYRSKNAEPKALSGSVSASGGFMRASPTVSLDSSSLSEILLPNSRTENSFRILEEAILSSGESIAASSVATTGTSATDNGNGNTNTNGSHSNGSSIASNSNRSSTSSTSTKKKNRSFNKIFRKVF